MQRRALAAGWGMVVLIVLSAPLAAAAQTRQLPRRPQGPGEGTEIPPGLAIADLKFGPFYLQPRLTVRDLGWDDNITGSPNGSPKTTDFRASPGGGLKIAVPIREEHLFSADGQLDYIWYASNDQLRTFNAAGLARYEYTSERFDLDFQHRYVDTQRTQSDTVEIGVEVVVPEYEIFVVARQLSNRTSASGRFNFVRRLFVDGSAWRNVIRVDPLELDASGTPDESDRTEEFASGGLGFRVTSRTALSLVIDWRVYDYVLSDSIRDAESRRVGGRIELDPASVLSGEVIVGYRRLIPREPGIDGFDGIVLNGVVGVRPRGIMSIELSGDRDTYPSIFGDNIYYLRQGAGVVALVQTVRGVGFGFEVSGYEHAYPVEATAQQLDGSSLTARRFDRIYQFVGRTEWRQSTLGTIAVRLGWVNRTSNFDFANSEGLVISTSYSLVY